MTPRPRSKRDLASDEVEHAISSASVALSKLGGRVRRGSKKLPADNDYIARQYLESVINRLKVVQNLIQRGLMFIEVENGPKIPYVPALKDDFEREYDRERNPQC